MDKENKNIQCDSCSDHEIDDKGRIYLTKRSIYISKIILLIFGALFGIYLTNSMGMFYNFIIMPAVGALGYIVLKKKYYIVPLGILVISYVLILGYYIIYEYKYFSFEMFTYPLLHAPIYALLSFVGIIIARLLKFAFKKEEQ